MLLLHGASSDACVCVSSTRGRGACRGVLNGNGDSNDEPHGACWGVRARVRLSGVLAVLRCVPWPRPVRVHAKAS
eukprot:scaffold72998_cov65-Phaeocystis_antarctica.AAC.5